MLSPNFSPFPDLATSRLLLRQLTMDDAAAVLRLRSNKEVMQHINRPLAVTIADAERWISVIQENLNANGGITWCIALKEDPSQHIGTIGLWRIEKENHRAEIGYMLEPALQGKGIMYEALEAVVDYGFTILKLHSIEAQIDPLNLASAALLRKGGFVQEAHFRENCMIGERFSDTAVFSLLTPIKESGGTAATVAVESHL